jgi:hypothetical protein
MTMRKTITRTTAVALISCSLGAWSYTSIKSAPATAAGAFTPASIDVAQLTRAAGPLTAEEFPAF